MPCSYFLRYCQTTSFPISLQHTALCPTICGFYVRRSDNVRDMLAPEIRLWPVPLGHKMPHDSAQAIAVILGATLGIEDFVEHFAAFFLASIGLQGVYPPRSARVDVQVWLADRSPMRISTWSTPSCTR
jgi:hypothetical protein